MQLPDGRTPAWLRGPAGLVDHTRWLFCGLALLSLLLTLPAPLSAGGGVGALLAVVASLALCSSWVLRYRRHGPPLVLDVVDVLATLAFAAACPMPAAAFSLIFAAVWLRALYGSTARLVLYCVGLAGAMAGSLLVWPLLPGHEGPVAAQPVLGGLPVFFVTVAVARHLALALFAREESRNRDAALVALSAGLLAVTDRSTIEQLAWQAATRICESSAGLRLIAVRPGLDVGRGGDQLQVLRTAGTFVAVPTVVPAAVLSADHTGTGVWPAQETADLDEAAGVTDGRWMCVALPEWPGAAMLLGAPGGVSPDALVAIRALVNQVALGMRNCDAHRSLALQAHTDSLTGLANRAAFVQALDVALASGHAPPTVLFLDLDDFKTVNDELGHLAGDELLRHVAARLGTAVRPEDLCARLGGDEFAVLLRGATPQLADTLAHRLVELVARPVELQQGRAPVGASVGVATADPSVGTEELMHRADVAMYAAKAQGKNRVQSFDSTLLKPDRQQPPPTDVAAPPPQRTPARLPS